MGSKSTLERDVKYLDEQYRIGNAIISDRAFDQLERNLLRTNSKCDYFIQKKNIFLPTIEQTNYKLFLKTLLKNTRLSIQPKIDGCAVALQYIGSKLTKAITREGTNVTSKIKGIKNIPTTLPIKRDFQVRGELFLPNQSASFSQKISSHFIETNQGWREDFCFCCFQILNGRLNQYETLNYLKKCGFSTPHSYYTNCIFEVEFYREEWLKGKLFENYPTDGIVIKINSRKLQQSRESNVFQRQEWQYAIKR